MVGSDGALNEIERQASRRRLPIIGVEKARIISRIVDGEKPRLALEVVTNVGYSTIVIAS